MSASVSTSPTSPSASIAARIDAALGRVPTYRLVAWCLAILAVISVLAAVPGWVGFAPIELLLHLITSVGTCWVVSRGMGALVGAAAHSTSAVITGLLLYFVLIPPDSAVGLLVVAGASGVAALSKFVIQVNGRHILNPAAFGAFVAGLTGLTGSIWWVASGVLLPFVAIAGVLVVVRTRTYAMVTAFVAVGALLDVIGQVQFGATPTDALDATLVSTPLVFLGVFMLTEPFTLPPRRWQRLAEAAIIGVGIGAAYLAPFHLGTLIPTPEAALLVGNVFSVLVARPVGRRVRITGRRSLTETSTEFTLTPDRPFLHRAGQYIELQVGHNRVDRRGIRRTFTIASPPGEPSGQIRIALRTAEPRSSLKESLCTLPLGSEIRVLTVSGSFTLPSNRVTPLLLVAGGIGITPFISQLLAEARSVEGGAVPRDIVLVYRAARVDDLPYHNELAALGVATVLVTTGRGLPAAGESRTWRIVDYLDADTLRSCVPDIAARHAYISGSPAFTAQTRSALRRTGLRHVRTDAFAGY